MVRFSAGEGGQPSRALFGSGMLIVLGTDLRLDSPRGGFGCADALSFGYGIVEFMMPMSS